MRFKPMLAWCWVNHSDNPENYASPPAGPAARELYLRAKLPAAVGKSAPGGAGGKSGMGSIARLVLAQVHLS